MVHLFSRSCRSLGRSTFSPSQFLIAGIMRQRCCELVVERAWDSNDIEGEADNRL